LQGTENDLTHQAATLDQAVDGAANKLKRSLESTSAKLREDRQLISRRWFMLRNVNDYRGGKIAATDGEIGSVEQVYFDDEDWRVRYFVVDTGGWLSGRKVLISPTAIDSSRSSDHAITVGLTREQIEHSPAIDTDKPVGKQYEEAYARHYGVSLWWARPGAAGLSTRQRHGRGVRKREQAAGEAEESRLRSSREVIGYAIHAADGKIGHVEDLRVDDRNWEVSGLVVDTREGISSGKKVLVSPDAVEDIDWQTKEVRLRLRRDEVERSSPA
jgi:sporulation protein YlmC with PRC-barrel domain